MVAKPDDLEKLRRLWTEAEIEWLNALEAEDEVLERTLPSVQVAGHGDATGSATPMDPEALQKNLQEQEEVKRRVIEAAQRLKEREQAYFGALQTLSP